MADGFNELSEAHWAAMALKTVRNNLFSLGFKLEDGKLDLQGVELNSGSKPVQQMIVNLF